MNGLRLGLCLQTGKAGGMVTVFCNNVDVIRRGVFVSVGLVKRLDFTAVSPGGKAYPIRQRAEYLPCGGFCDLPLIKDLAPGQTQQLEFATKDLLYVPEHAAVTELGTLLLRGYSVRVSSVTDRDLREAANQELVEFAWRGRVVSPEVRIR